MDDWAPGCKPPVIFDLAAAWEAYKRDTQNGPYPYTTVGRAQERAFRAGWAAHRRTVPMHEGEQT